MTHNSQLIKPCLAIVFVILLLFYIDWHRRSTATCAAAFESAQLILQKAIDQIRQNKKGPMKEK